MKYTIYDSNTGEIVSVYSTNDLSQVEVNLKDATYLEGEWNSKKYIVVNGQPVEKQVVAPTPTNDEVRGWRNGLLSHIDRVNPIWYNSLTTEQQTELAAYRQALLDVPAQSGFPASVVWPTKPAWL